MRAAGSTKEPVQGEAGLVEPGYSPKRGRATRHGKGKGKGKGKERDRDRDREREREAEEA
jgi:hypothetical protein